ncbi:MAG: hypothetical protein HYY04_17975 [Chloroflexi bacterium]|nr:hypothetical protein [Chloroflexota bacterium]
MGKMVTVRLDESAVEAMETVRDPERYPTQSDFIREAITRLIRQERRNRVRAEVMRAMQDSEEVRRQQELVGTSVEDWFARLEKADRGEL